MQRCAKRIDVVCDGCGMFAHCGIVRVHKVNELVFQRSVEQVTFQLGDIVPSHVWHFGNEFHSRFGLEALYLFLENTQAGSVAFFRMAAHQLQTKANSQHRLFKRGNQLI